MIATKVLFKAPREHRKMSVWFARRMRDSFPGVAEFCLAWGDAQMNKQEGIPGRKSPWKDPEARGAKLAGTGRPGPDEKDLGHFFIPLAKRSH